MSSPSLNTQFIEFEVTIKTLHAKIRSAKSGTFFPGTCYYFHSQWTKLKEGLFIVYGLFPMDKLSISERPSIVYIL